VSKIGSTFRMPVHVIPSDKSHSEEIDEVRNYFTNEVKGVELFSIIKSDIWKFKFSGTPYFFQIPSDGLLTRISFFNDVTRKKFSTEELLESEKVPDSVKKIVSWNIEIFSRTFKRLNVGWAIKENIGIGIVNPKGLAKLNVKKDK